MDFKDFEGFKRIKNEKHLEIDKIYEILEDFQDEMGDLNYTLNLDSANINIDIEGRYNAEIKISGDDIIIERYLEEGKTEVVPYSDETGKSIPLAQADRMIEQIYDIILDYMKDGIISEPITSAKEVLYMEEIKKQLLNSSLNIGREFEIKDDTKIIYKAVQNIIDTYFTLKNMSSGITEIKIDYSTYKVDMYTIKIEYDDYKFIKDNSTDKIRFKSDNQKNKIKVSADYSNNHYQIELNEIVIGAVDCKDPIVKEHYRIEVNNLDYRNIVIAVAIMLDVYNRKNQNGMV